MMRWPVVALAALAALAGCFDGGGKDPDGLEGGDGDGAASGSSSPSRTGTGTKAPGGKAPSGSGSPGSGSGGGSAGNGSAGGDQGTPGNGTNVTGPPREWALPAAAAIRPGASIDSGGCTANFVFTSLDNSTVYLGTAAHCFSDDDPTQTNGCEAIVQAVGAKRDIQGAQHKATMVYSSWSAMQARGASGDVCTNNDFALLELHPDDAAKVSPAMRTFGGPTGLAGGADAFQKILSYGNSGSRPEDSALSPREGYVTVPAGGCDLRVVFPNAAIPGDSGSPVILASGEALGVFVSIELTPVPGQGHVCLLADLLAYAAESGFPVRLATWDLIDDGTLP